MLTAVPLHLLLADADLLDATAVVLLHQHAVAVLLAATVAVLLAQAVAVNQLAVLADHAVVACWVVAA